MTRKGVTPEAVAAAAEALAARGQVPSNRSVRTELGGTGSLSTIARHLATWRAERISVTAPAELPPTIAKAIQAEIERITSERCAELQARLRTADQERMDLATEGCELEAECERLRQALERLEREHEFQARQYQEQANEKAGQAKVLSQLQSELEAARIGQAQALQEKELHLQRSTELEAARIGQAQALREKELHLQRSTELERQLQQAQAESRTEHEARIAAERELASMTARFELTAERLCCTNGGAVG
ncbi:DNA-binding protein [Caldimonas tepidiphila]|uniref:DNA-binding protein n=1 Tax=Caldimonas tepidiphila TaxID=2315841 RepID=UPI000E5BACBD|nr:DNA-binding protein [Caldimonas tepidiphila]